MSVEIERREVDYYNVVLVRTVSKRKIENFRSIATF